MDTRTLTRAYVALLATNFPGRTSLEGQQLLGDLRDAIADATHLPPQVVQETCETKATVLRTTWKWP